MTSSRFLERLNARWALLLFIMDMAALFLYGVGTVQGFTDETQIFILKAGMALALLLLPTSLIGIGAAIASLALTGKIHAILRAAAYFVLLLYGIGAALGPAVIIAASSGAGG